jgi:phospholipid transport system substrate-binding protein
MRLINLAFAFALLGFAGMLPSSPALAANPAEPLVSQFVDKSLGIIEDPQIAAIDRAGHFHDLFRQYFDIPVIARFVLGRYWEDASEEERRQFTDAFEEHLVRSYVHRFQNYAGEKFRITSGRMQDQRIIDSAEIIRIDGQAPVLLDWIVASTPSGLRIRDISMAGVSIAMTYRNEFTSVMQRNDGKVSALIAALRAPTMVQ